MYTKRNRSLLNAEKGYFSLDSELFVTKKCDKEIMIIYYENLNTHMRPRY